MHRPRRPRKVYPWEKDVWGRQLAEPSHAGTIWVQRHLQNCSTSHHTDSHPDAQCRCKALAVTNNRVQ